MCVLGWPLIASLPLTQMLPPTHQEEKGKGADEEEYVANVDGDGDGGSGEGDGGEDREECEDRDGDAEEEEEEDTTTQAVFRFGGNNVMTRAAINPANRRQIRPHGDWQWDNICWEGRNRLRPVIATLGTHCRFHYPGMVTIGGVLQPALKWEQYKLQSNDQGVMIPARVWNEFWERYCLPEGEEQCLQDRACSVFDKVATKVVRDMMSNARIQYVCLYYKK
ncbi:hypothetical protein PAHAL_2G199900 [Panicum hallii]|uniref:Uncharacterized protein n=1 Tax=Panicum hallii TaxID=206008 RepID=A0A2T8KPR5_9POAL|nr:hypothetical protein PAHAL_2G199900 [Panicum hallii]